MTDKLTVISAGHHVRLEEVLQKALENVPFERFDITADQSLPPLQNRRVLFAISVGLAGLDTSVCRLLMMLRQNPDAMTGSCAALLIDGEGELYTKQTAQSIMLAANLSGCWLMGKPLLEATGSLQNLDIRARKLGLSHRQSYDVLASQLVRKLRTFTVPALRHGKLLMLHASNSKTSNTLALGRQVCHLLEGKLQTRELSLRNGTIHDCNGCSYLVCSHFAEKGSCFYGGAMVQDVYPAVLDSDALLILCPNYNDALGANIMAFINRLTSLTMNNLLEGKMVFGIIVSGYSGGDLVAQQLLGALCLNKAFILPPYCCMMETANDPDTAIHLPGIAERLQDFAGRICHSMLQGTNGNRSYPAAKL